MFTYCGCTASCTPVLIPQIGVDFLSNLQSQNKLVPVNRSYKFCNQILFTLASGKGDSGSLLINADAKFSRWTGLKLILLHGVENRYSLANSIILYMCCPQ